jgi:4-oxalocrotonate tautomerase
VMRTLNYGAESVSVAFDEVGPGDWNSNVYQPDIVRNEKNLYKKPGYTM